MSAVVNTMRRLRTRLCNREQRAFRKFEEAVHPQTWRAHDGTLEWAQRRAAAFTEDQWAREAEESDDPIVAQGARLRRETLNAFQEKFLGRTRLRVVVHVPPLERSPGGYSVFKNLVDALNYIGIPACALEWGQDIGSVLGAFGPNVFLTSDHESYLSRIDWGAIARFREANELKIGLTASLEEYGNTPLAERMRWAEKNGVDFYYSFRSPEYLRERPEYGPFVESGYDILSVEFGANILQYFPVPGIARDIDYVFLASSNYDKWPRYFSYLPGVLDRHAGFIDGPGWAHVSRWARQDTHKFLYARARVGINLHIADSINWPCELNERTYILAACGVPQMVDRPKLLFDRFSVGSMCSANSPAEYAELFAYLMSDRDAAQKQALLALQDVYSRHTSFHRAEGFVVDILNIAGRDRHASEG